MTENRFSNAISNVSIEDFYSGQKENFHLSQAIPIKTARKSMNCLLKSNELPLKTMSKFSKDSTFQQSFTGQGIGPLFGWLLFLTLDEAQEVQKITIIIINA